MLRNLPSGAQWLNRSYSALATAALITTAIVATGLQPYVVRPAVAAAPAGILPEADDNPSSAGPPLASYLPNELFDMVGVLDVQAALSSPGGKQLRKTANLPEELELAGSKMQLADIDCILGAMLKPNMIKDRNAEPAILVVRLRKKIDNDVNVAGVQKLDDRTIALYSDDRVLNLLKSQSDHDEWIGLLQKNAECEVRLAGKSQWLRRALNEPSLVAYSQAISPLETLQDFSAGIQLNDSCTLTAQATSPDAKQVAGTVNALSLLASNVLSGERNKLNQATGLNPELLLAQLKSIDLASGMLNRLTVDSHENQIVAITSLDNSAYNLTALLMPAITASRAAAQRTMSMNNMKQLALALHNYHATHNYLPTSVVVDPESGMQRSWRVELLPFLDQSALYRQYRKDQPWDSVENLKVLDQMPQVFAAVGIDAGTKTPYQAIVGPGKGLAAKESGGNLRFRDFIDGLSNTVVMVETKELVPWTKPADLPDCSQAPQLGTVRGSEIIIAGFADGSVNAISKGIESKVWDALTTRGGGESPINLSN